MSSRNFFSVWLFEPRCDHYLFPFFPDEFGHASAKSSSKSAEISRTSGKWQNAQKMANISKCRKTVQEKHWTMPAKREFVRKSHFILHIIFSILSLSPGPSPSSWQLDACTSASYGPSRFGQLDACTSASTSLGRRKRLRENFLSKR